MKESLRDGRTIRVAQARIHGSASSCPQPSRQVLGGAARHNRRAERISALGAPDAKDVAHNLSLDAHRSSFSRDGQ
jgi:hypothetical protein